jgi:uncharacterized RDD family membrane protein YckC
MKCPKCGYLGFEPVERCRNCGYDFSLSTSTPFPDLAIRQSSDENIGPLDDLTLSDPPARASADALRNPADDTRREHVSHGVITPSELPLFGGSEADDTPLITRASPPRQPLAVRRATPDTSRLRTEARPAPIDVPLPDFEAPVISARRSVSRVETSLETAPMREAEESAGLVARAVAGVIDLVVLCSIDLAVIYFTMQICGVTLDDVSLLPKIPLLAFLILLDVGYLVAFTAGGQSLGKMASGIRIVMEENERAPDMSQALLRTLVTIALLLPAGLGFLSVLFDEHHRGLHDRAVGTRVVRASL